MSNCADWTGCRWALVILWGMGPAGVGLGCGGTNVKLPVCGNGEVEGRELCDDGNLEPGDGCDENCLMESRELCDNRIDDEEVLAVYDLYSEIQGLAIDRDLIDEIWASGGYRWDAKGGRYEVQQ